MASIIASVKIGLIKKIIIMKLKNNNKTIYIYIYIYITCLKNDEIIKSKGNIVNRVEYQFIK